MPQISSTALPPIGPDAPWLAPLAGYSDLPFRLLCRELGAAVACTEMVSAKGLVFGLRQGGKGLTATEELLATTPEDNPLVVQLFGAESEFLGEAVRILSGRGFRRFDLNMGCSVPKVTKTGAGAAMLRDVPNALRVAKAMIAAAGNGCVGFKLRLGWDASSRVYLSLARELAAAGASWLTLHPRYARQGFSGTAEAEALAELAGAVPVPVLASGDLFGAEDGVRCLEHTGVNAVMFARGAMANPAVFREYLAMRRNGEHPGEQSPAELLRIIRRHAELARAWTPGQGKGGQTLALARMRHVAPRYIRHLPGVKRLRLALAGCADWEQFDAVLERFFAGEALPARADSIPAHNVRGNGDESCW